MNTTTIRISACVLFFTALFLSGVAISAGSSERDVPKKFLVPPPPFSEGIFPCSQCHAGMPVEPYAAETRRHASEHRAEAHARRLVL